MNQTRSSPVVSALSIRGLCRLSDESAIIGSPGDSKSKPSIPPFSASAFSSEALATLTM